jgi:hypothetical protein
MPIISRKIATYSLACICAAAGFVGAYMATGTRAADRQCKPNAEHCSTTTTETTTTETTTPSTTDEGTTTTETTTPPPTTTTDDGATTTTDEKTPPPTTTTTDDGATTTTTTGDGGTRPATSGPGRVKRASIAAKVTSEKQVIGGQTLFSGFFNGGYQPWGTPQCLNYGNPVDNSQVHFGDFYIDTQNVGEGTSSGRFTLPAWSGGKTRCQVITKRSINVGGDDYYSLMFYVPAGGFQPGTMSSSASQWGVSIAELNFQNLGHGGPTIALHAQSDHVTLVMNTGVATTTWPYHQYRSNADAGGNGTNLPPLYAIPAPMQTGVWHEIVVHCHWATNSGGQVEVWHRVKGQSTWTKTVSLTGYPTLEVNPDGSYSSTTLDVTGAYRGPSSAPATVSLDGFGRWQSVAAAETFLP